jgi:hypothetical protein
MNPCGYSLRVYCTNPHTVQELLAEIEAVAQEMTGENFEVSLQGVREVEGSHFEHVFT